MRLTERTRKLYTCAYHGHLHYYPGCQCRLLRYKTYFIHFTNQIVTSPINKRRGPIPQRTSYRQQNRTDSVTANQYRQKLVPPVIVRLWALY